MTQNVQSDVVLKTVGGTEFIIDIDDLPLLEGRTFHLRGEYIAVYFPSTHYGAKNKRSVYLHKYLLGEPNNEVDHINGNKLDYRRENLRHVTKTEQNLNRAAWGEYPQGVSYDANKELYRARIQIRGKRISLGRFKRLEDAVAARQEYDRKLEIISGGV